MPFLSRIIVMTVQPGVEENFSYCFRPWLAFELDFRKSFIAHTEYQVGRTYQDGAWTNEWVSKYMSVVHSYKYRLHMSQYW